MVFFLRTGICFDNAINQSIGTLHDSLLWQSLAGFQSEALAWELFASSMRVQALLADIKLICQGYPYKLVDLLAAEQVTKDLSLAELYTAESCMLDSYAASLREKFPEPQDLINHATFAVELRVVLEHICGCTFSTERLHSRTGRAVKHRHMSHRPAVQDLGLPFAAQGAPPWTSHVGLRKEERKEERKQHAEETKLAEPTEKVKSTAKVKSKRGGGGAWRAYIHQQAQEVAAKKSVSFSALARGYRNLLPEQIAALKRLGQAATRAHASSGQAFPPTHKQLQHARDRKMCASARCLQDSHGAFSLHTLEALRPWMLGLQDEAQGDPLRFDKCRPN